MLFNEEPTTTNTPPAHRRACLWCRLYAWIHADVATLRRNLGSSSFRYH